MDNPAEVPGSDFEAMATELSSGRAIPSSARKYRHCKRLFLLFELELAEDKRRIKIPT